MKKALIIGANGFVGTHLANELKSKGYVCYGADIQKNTNKGIFTDTYEVDILRKQSIEDILIKVEPDYIINLAAISSVKVSWEKPAMTFDVNVKGTINLLETVRKVGINPRVLFIGSSEQYGKIDYSKPVKEDVELKSINPYGISKISQEKLVLMYKEAYGLDVILVRAFNHIGPGQRKGFVIPDFVSQIVEIERENKKAEMYVGNLQAERDFTDVRDIVIAYRLILEKGISGEVYNVGSGKSVSIRNILEELIGMSTKDIRVIIDSEKFRKIETPKIQCDNSKLCKHVGWIQTYSLKKSLQDIMGYWRSK